MGFYYIELCVPVPVPVPVSVVVVVAAVVAGPSAALQSLVAPDSLSLVWIIFVLVVQPVQLESTI